MVRKFVIIKGQQYDLWEIKSVEKGKEMPEYSDDWEYFIILNREGIATNLNNIRIPFDSEEERDTEIKNLKERLLEDDESITFI